MRTVGTQRHDDEQSPIVSMGACTRACAHGQDKLAGMEEPRRSRSDEGDGSTTRQRSIHAHRIAMGINGTTLRGSSGLVPGMTTSRHRSRNRRGRWIYDNIRKYLTFYCVPTQRGVVSAGVIGVGRKRCPAAAAILYIIWHGWSSALALGLSPATAKSGSGPPATRRGVFSGTPSWC